MYKMSEVLNQVILSDALEYLKNLPDECVNCIVTSPPYWNLRDYNVSGQMGMESTLDEYLENMTRLFSEARRVLRADGVLWLNMGDCYATSSNGRSAAETKAVGKDDRTFRDKPFSTGIGSNPVNVLNGLIKGQAIFIRDSVTIGISSKSVDIPLDNNLFPYGKLFSLFGIERIFIKQRDNDFCQVLNLFGAPSYCRISCSFVSIKRDISSLEIILDSIDSISVIISDHDSDTSPELGILDIGSVLTSEQSNSSFTVKESGKPITEAIRGGESVGDSILGNSFSESIPNIDFVNQSVTFANGLNSTVSDSGDFRITKASCEQVNFLFSDSAINFSVTAISHLLFLNQFGSFVSYAELYQKAERKANRMKNKNEIGISNLLKEAMVEDGWICRSTCIWHKPNPMPSSVKDRPTTAHEYVFLFAKSERYYFDPIPMQTRVKEHSIKRQGRVVSKNHKMAEGAPGQTPHSFSKARKNTNKQDGVGKRQYEGFNERYEGQTVSMAHPRTVWTIPTAQTKESHFATFPPDLIRPLIEAGCPAKVCAKCGKPWEREIEVGGGAIGSSWHNHEDDSALSQRATDNRAKGGNGYYRLDKGFKPMCDCGTEVEAGIVLDMFMGSGTTADVARRLGRNFIGCELNPDYIKIINKRLKVPFTIPMFI